MADDSLTAGAASPPDVQGPLLILERQLLDAQPAIERWFRLQCQTYTPPFYSSVDLRNAGFKLAPVDTNLFPGGFNNLPEEALPLAQQAITAAVERWCATARSVLLIPEKHTRNTFYLQNVARLSMLLRQAGLEVRLGSLDPAVVVPLSLAVPNQDAPLLIEPVQRNGNRVGLRDFDPCVVLLNNDLSAGLPAILQNLEQILLPPLHAGWAVRRKSNHFGAYDTIAESFAAEIGFDPWLINPYFARCGQINFHERDGEDCLARNVDVILNRIRKKYREYGITDTPFVIVKADAGTYGMGVMSVKDPEEVRGLNRKERNKMSVVKEGLSVTEVLLQEGVHTYETVNGSVAEPVVYMMDRYVVGGFYRVHTDRGRDQNLNAPGMHFVPLPFGAACNQPDPRGACEALPNLFYVYGVVARLAMLAASLELQRTAPTTGVTDLAPTLPAALATPPAIDLNRPAPSL